MINFGANKKFLKIQKSRSRKTDNTIESKEKGRQWSLKHYTESEGMSNRNSTINRL